jgi:hypothetical protein
LTEAAARMLGRPLETADRASQAASAGRAAPTRPTPVDQPGYIHLGNWANLAQFVTGNDRREQRHERRLRDRVRRERWAVPLAHTRPAGWAISIILNQASPGNGPDESADRSTAFEPVLESLLLP